MKINKAAPLYSEVLCYSPIRQQWLTALNTNGTVEGLLPREWFNSKLEALKDLKQALRFREGLVVNCTPICNRICKITEEIERLEKRVAK